jgi:hypothetical protein
MARTMSQGMTGPDVRSLQDVLNFHIRRGAQLKVDGIFGPKTRARVLDFQKSNKLVCDGLVGPKTQGKLYTVTELAVPIVFMPRLELPTFEGGSGFGIRPPRLIPQLQWPGPPLPAPPPFTIGGSFRLLPLLPSVLPELNGPANALGLKITMPKRQDPLDPAMRSRLAIIDLIDDLPVDSKFRAFLISKVPNPLEKFQPPDTGFQWGVKPLFDPFDPKGFGVSGNAEFMIRVSPGTNGTPNVVFGAWGDGKFFLNFDTKQGEARPKVEAEGQVFLGFKGVF